jgi:alkylation response protein AidB-like acyl-CoA dehydrogenase
LGGQRDIERSASDLAFRDDVRSFLDERGWAAPAWPVEYGRCDWSLTQHYIFSRERAELSTRQSFPKIAGCATSTPAKNAAPARDGRRRTK